MVDAEMPAETIHKEYGVLRRILAQAIDDDRLSANPALKVKLPPITPAEMRFLTLDQLRALANAAGTDAAAIRRWASADSAWANWWGCATAT
ncbi:phage integrase SAM-like domain-containing protein [Tsukamurella sp. PLM1]|uniref:phage integrase SAM-like domain-containing protein n=1 Tax=Tsukamurella sp. PLM1 TaxID=2929795 RepID=UPI0020BF9E37|nr:phage integrase SAM-like domain-containing protein [Tsukamurella sp. PLM1]